MIYHLWDEAPPDSRRIEVQCSSFGDESMYKVLLLEIYLYFMCLLCLLGRPVKHGCVLQSSLGFDVQAVGADL
jgi:hypothetical protein